MNLVAEATTHRGIGKRRNEDTVGVSGWISCGDTDAGVSVTMPHNSGRPFLALVADGLGGHTCGHLASQIVARRLVDGAAALQDEESIVTAIGQADAEVFRAMEGRPEREGMGSTVAGVLVTTDRTIVFNVGDSRVYRYDSGYLGMLSTDDNPPRMPGQPADAPTRTLTQCLGGHARPRGLDPHLYSLADEAPLLICSDGLTDVLDDAAIAEILAPAGPGSAAALVRAVLERDGHDDVSAVVLRQGPAIHAGADEGSAW